MLIYIIYRYRKTCWLPLLGIALVILLSDQVASGLIKPLAERLRPSHEPTLSGMVHIVNDYTGGKYGFVSSHASNMFGLAFFMLFLVRRKWFSITIIIWASLISYSRIYLGVHYPGDVIGGAIVGSMSAVLAYWLVSWGLEKRKLKRKKI
jgi:undecaprenyl-diphosphatase